MRIEPGHWYAWQMLPGYMEASSQPYYSPIYVTRVVSSKTAHATFALDFINVLYLDGAQDFSLTMQTLRRHQSYLIADLLYADEALQRVAVISPIGFGWLKQHCRHIIEQFPPSMLEQSAQDDVGVYLDEAFPYARKHISLPR